MSVFKPRPYPFFSLCLLSAPILSSPLLATLGLRSPSSGLAVHRVLQVLLPPNVTGALHIAHPLTSAIQNVWIQYFMGAWNGQCWDSNTAYYRGDMGIVLVYDVTDESSFNNIGHWMKNMEQHASDNVNRILVGNKADMDESKRDIPTSHGQALADEYGIQFFKTSATTNLNVEQVFFTIARDVKQRLTAESETKIEPSTIKISKPDPGKISTAAPEKSGCCNTS